jgi:hypothetical protein
MVHRGLKHSALGFQFVKQRTACISQEDELKAVFHGELGINTQRMSRYESGFMSQGMSHVHRVTSSQDMS